MEQYRALKRLEGVLARVELQVECNTGVGAVSCVVGFKVWNSSLYLAAVPVMRLRWLELLTHVLYSCHR